MVKEAEDSEGEDGARAGQGEQVAGEEGEPVGESEGEMLKHPRRQHRQLGQTRGVLPEKN